MREPNAMDRLMYTIALLITFMLVVGGCTLIYVGQKDVGLSILCAAGTMFIFLAIGALLAKPWERSKVNVAPAIYDPPPPYRVSWGKNYRRGCQCLQSQTTEHDAAPESDDVTPVEASHLPTNDQQASQPLPPEVTWGATSVYVIDSPPTLPQHHLPSASSDSLASVHSSDCHPLWNAVSALSMHEKTHLPFHSPSNSENKHHRSCSKISVNSTSGDSEEEPPPPYTEAMRAWRAGVAGGGTYDAKTYLS